ncbi:MAG: SIS domain-containing protein [Candidatus Acidiferrales bacterium]
MKTFLDEILEQPAVLRRCLDFYGGEQSHLRRSLRLPAHSSVIFTGMGASLHAALPAVYYLNAHRLKANLIDTAELLHYRLPALSRNDCLVIVSQSGETAEIIRLLQRLRRRPRLVAITNNPQSTLAHRADYVLPLHAGAQRFASTKTYSASLFTSLLLASLWAEGTMSRLLTGLAAHFSAYERLLQAGQRMAPRLATAVGRKRPVVLLGRGSSLASALQGALLFKEVCARPAEGMTGPQFRHGPFELLARPLSALLFAPRDNTLLLNRRLRNDLLRWGSRLIWISATLDSGRGMVAVPLPRVSVPALAPLFEIVPIQFLTLELARRQGREPGRLRIASPVTRRE